MFFFDKEMYEKGLDLQKNMMDQYIDAVNNFTDYFQGGSKNEGKKQQKTCLKMRRRSMIF